MADASPPNADGKTDDNNNNNDNGNGNNTELFIAIAALIISLAAFFVSILQALQQYYSSARGYASCGPAVIGKWAKFRHRRFRWYEFRFEVQFLTPVIFVARPSNTRGPMGSTERSKITVLDGSVSSYEESCTLGKEEFEREEGKKMAEPGRVHTADNEGATWLDLLMAVQRMEEESRVWQGRVLGRYEGRELGEEGKEEWPPRVAGGHTLSVSIQRKKRSWDSVPDSASLTRPYATSTISHIVEVAAMLGVYWIVWDRSSDRYLAQGNGFILSGSNVEGLGLTFSFQKKGPAWFEAQRVVPNYSVKELCFGFCPTTFRIPEDTQNADESKSMGSLQLGSMEEIAETLVVLGCNARNVNYFRKAETTARHYHLFPVTFEILGMVGVVFQVKGTVFRTLPNPTVFRWDSKSFDMLELLREYSQALKRAPGSPKSGALNIASHLETIIGEFDEWKAMSPTPIRTSAPTVTTTAVSSDVEAQTAAAQNNSTITQRRWALPKSLSAITTTPFRSHATAAQAKEDKAAKPIPPQATYSPAIFSALHAAIEACDEHLNPKANRQADSLLRLVLRAHVQAVLGMINPKAPAPETTSPTSPRTKITTTNTPTIEDLDAASDRKNALLMEMYFGRVRAEVVGKLNAKEGVEASMGQEVGGVWDVLMFRMLCWLLLHHFHDKDVQQSKSDVFESRMPVYIV